MAATTLGSDIITRALTLIVDPAKTRWPDPESLLWINEGQCLIAIYRPDASVTNESIQLSVGSKQAIPANCLRLMELTRNMGADGNTVGRAICEGRFEQFDKINPNWHLDTPFADNQIRNYLFRATDPKHFYVWPPVAGANPVYVEGIFSVVPAALTEVGQAISIDDTYAPILVDYLLYRSYLKNTNTPNLNRAQFFRQAVADALGIKAHVDLATLPDPVKEQTQAAARAGQGAQ